MTLAERDSIAIENLELAKAVAAKMRAQIGNAVEFDDLHGWALLAMLKALGDYDPGKFALRGFLLIRIRQGIIDAIRSNVWDGRSGDRPQHVALNPARGNCYLPWHASALGFQHQLDKQVSRLNPKRRAIIQRYCELGGEIQEVARALGMAPAAVQAQIYFAVGDLRRLMRVGLGITKPGFMSSARKQQMISGSLVSAPELLPTVK